MEAMAALELISVMSNATTKSEPADAEQGTDEGGNVEPKPSGSRGPPKKRIKTEGHVKADPEEKKPAVGESIWWSYKLRSIFSPLFGILVDFERLIFSQNVPKFLRCDLQQNWTESIEIFWLVKVVSPLVFQTR